LSAWDSGSWRRGGFFSQYAARGRPGAGGAGIQRQRAGGTPRAGRDEHDELAVAGEGDVKPLAWGRAVGVGQDGCALKDVGLLEVVGRHGDAPLGGAGVEGGDELGVAAEGEGERFGDGFAGEVVFSGAEAAHDGENVDAAEGGADGGDEVLAAVADDGLEGDGDAYFVEPFCEIEGVGVLTPGVSISEPTAMISVFIEEQWLVVSG